MAQKSRKKVIKKPIWKQVTANDYLNQVTGSSNDLNIVAPAGENPIVNKSTATLGGGLQTVLLSTTKPEAIEDAFKKLDIHLANVHVKQLEAKYDSKYQELDSSFKKFESEAIAEIDQLKRDARTIQEVLETKLLLHAVEVQEKKFALDCVIRKKEVCMRYLKDDFPGMSLDDIERVLDATDGERKDNLDIMDVKLKAAVSTWDESELKFNCNVDEFVSNSQFDIVKANGIETDLSCEAKAAEQSMRKIMTDIELKDAKKANLTVDIQELQLENTLPVTPVKLSDLNRTNLSRSNSDDSLGSSPPRSRIPNIPGIIPFSPETIRKKAEKRLKNTPMFDGDLEYTDMKYINGEWVLLDLPENNKPIQARSTPRILFMNRPVRKDKFPQKAVQLMRRDAQLGTPSNTPSKKFYSETQVPPPLGFEDLNDTLKVNTSLDFCATKKVPENIFLDSTATMRSKQMGIKRKAETQNPQRVNSNIGFVNSKSTGDTWALMEQAENNYMIKCLATNFMVEAKSATENLQITKHKGPLGISGPVQTKKSELFTATKSAWIQAPLGFRDDLNDSFKEDTDVGSSLFNVCTPNKIRRIQIGYNLNSTLDSYEADQLSTFDYFTF